MPFRINMNGLKSCATQNVMVVSIPLQSTGDDIFVDNLNKKHVTDFGWTLSKGRHSCIQWDALPRKKEQLNDFP